jgi:hypothetical protein
MIAVEASLALRAAVGATKRTIAVPRATKGAQRLIGKMQLPRLRR